jgi:hypothetical protein
MIPMEEYLEKFPPRRFNGVAKALQEASTQPRSAGKAYELIETIRLSQYQPLDFHYKGKNLSSPIMVSTLAQGKPSVPIDLLARRSGYTYDEIKAMKDAGGFTDLTTSPDIAWPGKLHEPSSAHALSDHLDGFPIQISNLDPHLVQTDPDYTPSVLVSTFDHYFRQFVGGGGTIPPELVHQLKAEKVNFLMTTHDPKVAAAIRHWKPAKGMEFDLKDELGTKTVWEEINRQSGGKIRRPSDHFYTFRFDLDQVANLRYYIYQKNGMNPEKIPSLRLGYHWWLQGASEP